MTTLALEVIPLVLLGWAYLRRTRSLAARGRPVALARRLSFALGLLIVFAAVGTPLAHMAEELFLAHMVQHILLGDLGALLLVFGLTGPVLAPALRVRVLNRLRVLGHPLVAFPLWMVNLYCWHLSALYQASLSAPAVHAVMHAAFLGLGVAMWMPLLGPLPTPAWFGDLARLIYVFAIRLAGALLANVFIWSQTVYYPDYAPGQAEWDIAPLTDQATAGAILMIEGSILTVVLFGWLLFRAARHDEQRQALLDFARDHGLALTEERAARAAASGQAGALRAQLERRATSKHQAK